MRLVSNNDKGLSILSKLKGQWLEMTILFWYSLLMAKGWVRGSETHVQKQTYMIYVLEQLKCIPAY